MVVSMLMNCGPIIHIRAMLQAKEMPIQRERKRGWRGSSDRSANTKRRYRRSDPVCTKYMHHYKYWVTGGLRDLIDSGTSFSGGRAGQAGRA